MKKILYLFPAVLLVACGGEEETSTEESTNETVEQDTSSVDTTTVVEEVVETLFLEDYAKYSTKTELYDAFGTDNIIDETAWYAEGTYSVETSLLTDPETGNMIQFSWSEEDGETLDFLETWNNTWFSENPKEQRVETKEGLYTGMPLTELVDWNEGKHFTFSGFGWDYAGGVFDTEGTKLASSAVSIQLTMLDDGYSSHSELIGDVQFNTADIEVEGAPVVIGTITYYVKK